MENKTFEDRENNFESLKRNINIIKWDRVLNDDQTMKGQREQPNKIWKYIANVTWRGDMACGWNTEDEAYNILLNRVLEYKEDFNVRRVVKAISKPA